VGRELGGYRGRGGERGLSLAATRDKGAARTWRRQLHGLHVVQRWRAVDSAGVRWRVVIEPPWCCRMRVGVRWPRHAALGPRGPLASGSYRFSEFFKILHLPNFEIQNSDLSNVQNSPQFA
jgi:hypothetical protein